MRSVRFLIDSQLRDTVDSEGNGGIVRTKLAFRIRAVWVFK